MNNSFWENIHFGRLVVGMVWIRWSSIFRKHPFRKLPLFYSSFSSNHPGGKKLMRQGIESIPFPKQQQRPLPSLLSVSFFYCMFRLYQGFIVNIFPTWNLGCVCVFSAAEFTSYSFTFYEIYKRREQPFLNGIIMQIVVDIEWNNKMARCRR